MHKVWISTDYEGIDENVGVIIVDADPGTEPIQIAASAMLALSKAVFTVRGTFHLTDEQGNPSVPFENPMFGTDELKEWLA